MQQSGEAKACRIHPRRPSASTMGSTPDRRVKVHPADQQALRHLATHGGSLCTLIQVEGSYSRRIGAQLSIAPDGSTAGDLADHCLERELAHQASQIAVDGPPKRLLYGKRSPFLDFQLPCGSTIELLIDPAPDTRIARKIVETLDTRRPAELELPIVQESQVQLRKYLPSMRIIAFGEVPEAGAMQRLAHEYGAEVTIYPAAASEERLRNIACDAWTAIVCLSHDHEWERAILPWALTSDAFYVGAIGGANATASRHEMLLNCGLRSDQIARLRAPIGLFPSARHPAALALSTFAEIAARYERLFDD